MNQNERRAYAAEWSEYDQLGEGNGHRTNFIDLHAGDLAELRHQTRLDLQDATRRHLFLRYVAEAMRDSKQNIGDALTAHQLNALHRKALDITRPREH